MKIYKFPVVKNNEFRYVCKACFNLKIPDIYRVNENIPYNIYDLPGTDTIFMASDIPLNTFFEEYKEIPCIFKNAPTEIPETLEQYVYSILQINSLILRESRKYEENYIHQRLITISISGELYMKID